MGGYKNNAQKSVAFLYTNDEAGEREIKESIAFTTAQKTMRYPGIKLTKEVEDLYSKTTEHLGKKLRKTQKDGKTFHAHALEE